MGPEDMVKLESALKNNIEIISLVGKRNDYFKHTRALFTYLYDHPMFNKLITEARKKLGVPAGGFETREQGFHWQFSNKTNSKKIRTLAQEIVSKFNIDPALISPTRFFTEDFILSSNLRHNNIIGIIDKDFPSKKDLEILGMFFRRGISALRAIRTTDDSQINGYLFRGGTTYLEITEYTSKADLLAFLKKFKGGNRERRIFVPRLNDVQRYCWRHQSDDEIVAYWLQRHKKRRLFMPREVQKERAKYKETLSKFRRF